MERLLRRREETEEGVVSKERRVRRGEEIGAREPLVVIDQTPRPSSPRRESGRRVRRASRAALPPRLPLLGPRRPPRPRRRRPTPLPGRHRRYGPGLAAPAG